MKKYAIAFDVGGSFIKTAILNNECNIIPDSFAIYPSKSDQSKDKIIDHFVDIIKQQTNRILDKKIKIFGIGYAFPGPFDYEKGISYIKGVDKFEQLYGINLGQTLQSRLNQLPSFKSKMDVDFNIVFENDANLFALGEQRSGKGRNYTRSIYLMIGTGLGSAFMDDGNLVKGKYGIPENGWIYNEPFGQSIIDDYISKRGILKLADERGVSIKDNEVRTLAEIARSNNHKAMDIFHRFGQNIGKAVNPYVHSFNPESIIIGGQIAKSKDLFMSGIKETLEDQTVVIEYTDESSQSTFVGIANLLRKSINVTT